MSKLIDLTGQRFGRLTVIGQASNLYGRTAWNCQCDCGNSIVSVGWTLRSEHTQSCGCYQKDQMRIFNHNTKIKHGGCINERSRLYRIWSGMRQRCADKGYHNYASYGGRGITVCSEWQESFDTFKNWALNNGYTESLSIDRINNNAGYYPSNCRWATNSEQQENKRNTKLYALGEKSQGLKKWASEYDVEYWLVWQRVNRNGMNLLQALTQPIRGRLCG